MKKRIILITLGIFVILIICSLFAAEYYSSRPQFCGSCHIMKKYYDSWKQDKHSEENVTCVECHYPPGEKHALKSKFKGLGQLFTYLGTGTNVVRTPAKVSDLSCTTSNCHPDEKFMDKKIKFTEKISYVHATHKNKTIEGQALHCDTCHQHVTPEKHFEVPRMICYLCHFKETKFNEGRSKCTLCHLLPEKPIQKQKKEGDQEEKPVTHKYLEEVKVACPSCHYELVQGSGGIKKEDCFNCHEYSQEMLKKADDKKAMHTEHVAAQNANCFDCHMPIEHKEISRFDAAMQNCTACHPEPHIYQKMLITGTGGKGIDKPYPIAHLYVNVNCFACHVDDGVDAKGRKVKRASPKACVECHMKDEQKQGLGKKWQSDVLEYLTEARGLEKQAIAAIENAKDSAPKKTIQKAMALMHDGQENLRLVDAGGGVHNKKYAMLLIDAAITYFEDAIEEVNKRE